MGTKNGLFNFTNHNIRYLRDEIQIEFIPIIELVWTIIDSQDKFIAQASVSTLIENWNSIIKNFSESEEETKDILTIIKNYKKILWKIVK